MAGKLPTTKTTAPTTKISSVSVPNAMTAAKPLVAKKMATMKASKPSKPTNKAYKLPTL